MHSSRNQVPNGGQWISNTKMWILLEVAVSRIDSFQIETELNRCVKVGEGKCAEWSLSLSVWATHEKCKWKKLAWNGRRFLLQCFSRCLILLSTASISLHYLFSLSLSLSFSVLLLCSLLFLLSSSLEFVSFARKTAQFRPQCSLRRLG